MRTGKKCTIILVIAIIFLLISVVNICLYLKNDDMVAVLGYHGVLPKELNTSGDQLIIDSESFEDQIKTLKIMGYHTMTLDEFYCWKNGECKKNHKSVLITFDDGYQNNYDYAFKILEKYDMNAVVFCVGDHINSNNDIFMNMDTINKSLKKYKNIEFASHSYNLHHRGDRGYESVINDSTKMKELINSKYYAYPYGEYNNEYIRALKDNDYKMAFTFGPGAEHRKAVISDDNYKVPRLNISKEMSILKFLLRVTLPI